MNFLNWDILGPFYDDIGKINDNKGQILETHNGCAFQYTKLHVLDNILQDGYLHCTSVDFLNDTGEYDFAFNPLKLTEKELKKYEYFSMSFTLKEDDIPQYLIYAGEIGLGIEYDFTFDFERGESEKGIKTEFDNDFQLACYLNNGEEEFNLGANVKKPIKIRYEDKKDIATVMRGVNDELKIILKKANDNENDNRTLLERESFFACFFKDKAFESEQEVRIALGAFKINDEIPLIEFKKTQNRILCPFIKLFYRINCNSNDRRVGWPIKSIWVGPGRDQERAFKSVKMRLETGEVMVFPLPLHIFLERLVNFVYKAIWFFKENLDLNNELDSDAFLKKVFGEAFLKFELLKNGYWQLHEDIVSFQTDGNIIDFTKKIGNSDSKVYKCLGLDYDARVDADRIINEVRYKLIDALTDFITDKYAKNEYNEMVVKGSQHNNVEFSRLWGKGRAVSLIEEFERFNYFSSYGIAVYSSRQRLSPN